mgnify:CR=1 FL=1|jgi:DNA polymerase-4
MVQRTILHSDLNSFYASVEAMLNPKLRGKAVAVCGSTENRHGIVLAKSELAKRAGVKTGMVNWEATQCCPNLIMVQPHYDQYVKYSKLTRAIYDQYTDQIEPFGMDECWLDVTGSRCHGDGLAIAEAIRTSVYEQLGLTVSIGVSFTKIFAKLGSDMKKPDAITCITPESYRTQVWPLPASDLLYVGRATTEKLRRRGIETIGGIAQCDKMLLKSWFGVNGIKLWEFANGVDNSRVRPFDYEPVAKSVGHGITCTADLENNNEVLQVLFELAQGVSLRLRQAELIATRVQLYIRDCNLNYREFQCKLPYPTQSWREMVNCAMELFRLRYTWQYPIRSVTIRAVDLISTRTPQQLDLFGDQEKRKRNDDLEIAIEDIQRRFGRDAIRLASSMNGLKVQKDKSHEQLTMPAAMYV